MRPSARFPISSVTAAWGAFLLFVVQPLCARTVLPILGGTPWVWTGCVTFYQAMLLLGYALAHAGARWLTFRTHAAIHLGCWTLGWTLMPIPSSANSLISSNAFFPPTDGGIASAWLWLWSALLVQAGIPLIVVSATMPTVLHWRGRIDNNNNNNNDNDNAHATAGASPKTRDQPYVIAAASNFGSLLALLSYPFLIEPWLGLSDQARYWSFGYACLGILLLACAAATALGETSSAALPDSNAKDPASASASGPITAKMFGRWMLGAGAPASLMLGVTTLLTNDVAATPLFWTVPLAMYLLSYILAFLSRPWFTAAQLGRAVLVLTPSLMISLALFPRWSWPMVFWHLIGMFVIAWACHAWLAEHKPEVQNATSFTLALACGGFLGGVFQSLIAPAIFPEFWEYPLALALCGLCLDRSPPETQTGTRYRRIIVRVPPGATTTRTLPWFVKDALNALILGTVLAVAVHWASTGVSEEIGWKRLWATYAAAACWWLSWDRRPLAQACGVCAFALSGYGYLHGLSGELLYQTRSLYGIHRISREPVRGFHLLQHGVTYHGLQDRFGPNPREPLGYYHRSGPWGDLIAHWDFSQHNADHSPASPLSTSGSSAAAVVGLGTGALAAYPELGSPLTFYEIDPSVAAIASDPRWFTYLSGRPADTWSIVLGDGRLGLQRSGATRYRLIVLDAFTSDAVPTHLLTREALGIYLDHLDDDGLLVWNITNRMVNLEPVLARLAADRGLSARCRSDLHPSAAETAAGRFPAVWFIAARNENALGALANTPRWRIPKVSPTTPLWTDDHAPLLRALGRPAD